ncbi:ABC transporter ATP-binding protein [Psychrobacter sp. I-STPA10]|uniref:ABC transporter ATP-binding protein n=1 Tax=Psychrobacter sp. I-STPA10 TaxID=2585769 RepID=UPI001E630C48|nr:ABC transporter ATP-binding protein [Psychrobacter sp. I-STPA10]
MKPDMKSATNSNASPTLNNSHNPSPTTSTTSQPLLYANNLSKSVSVGEQRIDIIKGIDVAVQAGEFAVIMGKSGSGKSTLLGLLAGLDYPDSGEVWLDGQNLTKLDEEALAQKRQQDMGFVFQSFHLLPTLTVAENIAFPLDIARRPDPSRVEELLTAVGLAHRRDSLPHQLSGGEQQRTALARALVARPKIIFADEPTGNLDEQNAQQVMHLLLELQQQSGTALVVVTHDSSLSIHANQVITIVDGRVAG